MITISIIIVTILTIVTVCLFFKGIFLLCKNIRQTKNKNDIINYQATIYSFFGSIISALMTCLIFFQSVYPNIKKQNEIEPTISLNNNTLNLFSTDEHILEATIFPNDVEINWKSDNPEIVTVDNNGHIKAVIDGITTITASIEYNGETYSDTCTILVNILHEENVFNDSDDANNIFDNGRNTFINDTSIPVSDRVLIPEDSLYPNINMVAITEYDSFGVSGYQGAQRTFDAVASPFTKSTIDSRGLFTELEYEILKNPVVGDMIARGIIDEYSEIENEAPCIKEFVDVSNRAYEEIYEYPEKEDTGLYFWMTAYRFADDETEIYVTNEYRKYSESLCQLLETFVNYGVHTFTSKKGYVGNIVTSEKRRTEIIDDEATYPALIFYKIDENDKIVCVIGFDLNDKGLFIYDTNVIQP